MHYDEQLSSTHFNLVLAELFLLLPVKIRSVYCKLVALYNDGNEDDGREGCGVPAGNG